MPGTRGRGFKRAVRGPHHEGASRNEDGLWRYRGGDGPARFLSARSGVRLQLLACPLADRRAEPVRCGGPVFR